jgi:hypothetical protein
MLVQCPLPSENIPAKRRASDCACGASNSLDLFAECLSRYECGRHGRAIDQRGDKLANASK